MTTNGNGLDYANMERIVPDELRPGEATGSNTLRLHMERYEFARQHLVPGRVLDIACGVGYGTELLSRNPQTTQALGVDVDASAVDYATRRYGNERVSYVCADALSYSPMQTFDNVVSLETIEHVDDPRGLFAHLVSMLPLGGRLIASVPVTPSVDANPHHRTNFSISSFRRLGEALPLKFLTSFEQVQPFSPFAISLRRETRAAGLRRNLARFYLGNPSHFFLRVWSTLKDGFVNKYVTVVWEKIKIDKSDV